MLPFHPLADIFPLIEGDEFLALVEDIRAHGVRERIVLLDRQVLDGRNRQRALAHLIETGELLGKGWGDRADSILTAQALDPPQLWFAAYNQALDGEPLAWVISKNLKRRHLDESQRAMVGAKLANLTKGQRRDRVDGSIDLSTAARMLNVSEPSIKRARSVQASGSPELQHAVEQGRVAVSTAEAIASLPQAEQSARVATGDQEILGAAKAIRARQRQVRFVEVNAKLAKIAEGNSAVPTARRYPIVYLDPATKFKSGFGDRSIENHYPTMEWDAIRALPLGDLATDDAVMLCWSTVPHLVNTLAAIERWGFAYVSNWCWDKVDPGTGYWGFGQHEHLLIATRGNFPAPLPGTQPRSLYREKKTGHSVKPAWFAEQIERIWPDLPKVELFSRAPRAGWAAWGNQAAPPEQAERSEAVANGGNNKSEQAEVQSIAASCHSPASFETRAAPAPQDDGSPHPLDIPAFLRRRAS
jgi:N6-adenosine-specific RNA methylase IME4